MELAFPNALPFSNYAYLPPRIASSFSKDAFITISSLASCKIDVQLSPNTLKNSRSSINAHSSENFLRRPAANGEKSNITHPNSAPESQQRTSISLVASRMKHMKGTSTKENKKSAKNSKNYAANNKNHNANQYAL